MMNLCNIDGLARGAHGTKHRERYILLVDAPHEHNSAEVEAPHGETRDVGMPAPQCCPAAWSTSGPARGRSPGKAGMKRRSNCEIQRFCLCSAASVFIASPAKLDTAHYIHTTLAAQLATTSLMVSKCHLNSWLYRAF